MSASLEGEKGDQTWVSTEAVSDKVVHSPFEDKHTFRHLKPRHIQLITLSGAIGTGLYIGSGNALKDAGPLGLLLGFTIYGALVYSSFNAMGEMVSYLPIDGSYVQYAGRFVDPSFGFATSWVVFYNYAISIAQEAVAGAGLVNYWNDTISNGVWVTIFLLCCVIMNVFGVKYLGEAEFHFSIYKVLLIMGLLVFTFVTMLGGNPQHDRFGFRYWKHPGPMNEYIAKGSLGQFLGFFSTFVTASYSYGGPDYLALTAGEAQYPRRVFPNVFRRVIWRLLIFYIGGVLAVGILVPYTDPALGKAAKGAGSSPFVLAATRMKIPALPSIINAAILTSAWSNGVANSFSASRVLYSLALRGWAPAIFKWTWHGVPTFAILAVTAVGCLGFMSLSNGAAEAFLWITNIMGALWIMNVGLQHIIYLRFRAGVKAQGIDRSQFPFFKKRQLLWSRIALASYTVLFLTNGFPVFTKGRWSVRSFIFAYICLPIFLGLYFGHKIYSHYRLGTPWRSFSGEEMDLTTGKEEVDEDEKTYPPYGTKPKDKFFHWLWGA